MSNNNKNNKSLGLIVNMQFEIPITPNFIRLSSDKEKAIPIEKLTDEQLKILGQAWTNKLIERAREKRKHI
mgnify:CR=1 FL=1|jgi:hypothetical protein